MNVFDLVASLRLDDSEYNEGLGKSKSAAASFASGTATALAGATKATIAATAAVGGAMVAGTAQTAAYGDQIDKMSQKLGISAEAYQEWDAVLQHSGTSIDSMTATFKKLATASQDATDDQVAAFQAIGLSMDQVSAMSAEELFGAVVTGLQGMEEGTERTALATELLGKGAMELGALLNTSAEDTQAMRDEVHALGGVMSDEAVKAAAAYQDTLQDMKTGFTGLKNNLMGSFMPAMTTVMKGITGLMKGDKGAVSEITNGIKLFITNIKSMIPKFTEAGGEIIGAIVSAIAENLPSLAESAIDLVMVLFDGIIEQLPLITDSATQIITTIIMTLAEHLPEIIQAGIDLIVTLANGLAEQIPQLVPVILDAIILIVNTLIQNAPQLLKAALTLIMALAKGLIDYLPKLIEQLPTIIQNIVDSLTGMSGDVLSAGITLLLALAKGLIEAIPQLVLKIPEILASLVGGFLEGVAQMADVGLQLIQGLWNGINNAKDWILDKIKGFGSSILGGIKDFFGIASPSKEMAKIGDFMTQGLAKGWDDTVGDVIEKMNDDMNLEGNATMNLTPGGIGDFEATATQGDTMMDYMALQFSALFDAQIERLTNAMANVKLAVVLDSGVLVGEIAQDMDKQLGIEAGRNAR